jgi:uncharacterized heparinase superfamily protein
MRLARTVQKRYDRVLWSRRLQRPLGGPLALRRNAGLAAVSQRKLAESCSQESRANAQRITQDRYRFLHREIVLPAPLDWRLERRPEATHLWRFHLHYHAFLLDLAAEGLASGDPQWCRKAWALVVDWIDNNRLDDRRVLNDAWHPYCISRRLPAWIHLWSASAPDVEIQNRVLWSMLCQARYLETHLELDLGGNHLLENARALALLGAFLDGPDAERWLNKAARLFQRELPVQLLPHGEHFERSPMYHVEMLEAVLDVADAVADVLPELSDRCRRAAATMADFLRAVVHPDGQIPLLGDSCLNQAPPIAQLLQRAERVLAATCPRQNELSDVATKNHSGFVDAKVVGGYWRYRHADDFLLFDAEVVGPDHLPAHAHADLLSVEASVHGQRLLTDSGVFSYEDDAMRRYCRSTCAHNVLQIDGADQCDMWSRFRMGSRGWPSPLVTGQQAGFCWASASHNAYRGLGVATVGRWLACRPGGPWFCVDWAQGHGRHTLTSWLHLHPDVTVGPAGDELQLLLAGQQLRLQWLTPGQVTIDEGWYCPQIGQRQRAPAVRWERSCAVPTVCGWCLVWGDVRGTATLRQTAGGNSVLCWAEQQASVELHLGFP